jgi:predicted small integral membrane protein
MIFANERCWERVWTIPANSIRSFLSVDLFPMSLCIHANHHPCIGRLLLIIPPLIRPTAAKRVGVCRLTVATRRGDRHRIRLCLSTGTISIRIVGHAGKSRRESPVRLRKNLHKWRVARPWDLLFSRKLTELTLCIRDLCGCCDLNPWAPRVNVAT